MSAGRVDVHPIVHSRVPLIKITDIPTNIACDISMENDLSIYKVDARLRADRVYATAR